MIEEDVIGAGGPACPLSFRQIRERRLETPPRALQMQAMQSLSRSEAEA